MQGPGLFLGLPLLTVPSGVRSVSRQAETSNSDFTIFMDDLDGLETGCMSVTIAVLAGSLLGFLLWNWSPAKVFMGDVGSTFLGAVFAGLMLQAASWPACVPSPPSPSVSAAASGRLASRPRVPHHHRGHGGAGGGHARVAGDPVLGLLRLAWDVMTQPCPEGAPTPDRFVVAIGTPVLRQRWQPVLEAAGAPVGVVVHPSACLSSSAQLAPGCVVLAGAVINADARLERGVLVNSGAVVDHDAICGVYSQLGVSCAGSSG